MRNRFYFDNLQEALSGMKTRFPMPEEFPLRDDSNEMESLCSLLLESENPLLIHNVSSAALPVLLKGLAGKEGREASVLTEALCLRPSTWLFRFGWALLQYHPDDPALLNGMNCLGGVLQKKKPAVPGSLESMAFLPFDNTLEQRLLHGMQSWEGPLRRFTRHYGMITGSALLNRIYADFFKTAPAARLKENASVLLEILPLLDTPELKTVIKNYLSAFEVREYPTIVNEYLIRTYGLPGDAPFWVDMDSSLNARLLQWHILQKLEELYKAYNPKLIMWEKFIAHIRHIHAEKDSLIIDMGPVIAVDRDISGPMATLYERAVYQNDPAGNFDKATDRQWLPEARDYILHARKESITLLNFFEANRLYVEDMLEDKLTVKLTLKNWRQNLAKG